MPENRTKAFIVISTYNEAENAVAVIWSYSASLERVWRAQATRRGH